MPDHSARVRLTKQMVASTIKKIMVEDLEEMGGNSLKGGEDLVALASKLNDARGDRVIENVLREANKTLGMHGVEAIWGEQDSHTPVATYLNAGDTYSLTLVHDYQQRRLLMTSYEDWVSNYENRGGRLKAAASVLMVREAALATGLYGYTKAIQSTCESCTRKLSRKALSIAKRAYGKDEEVVGFLQSHAKRARSHSAKVLLAAMKELGPRVAMQREAGAPEYGLYGFKARTADIGLQACSDVRSSAGRFAADLHHRKGDLHDKITGFFQEHGKQGRCIYSKMLHSCYPDAPTIERVASMNLEARGLWSTDTDWLEWE